jgi:hypothetical protein
LLSLLPREDGGLHASTGSTVQAEPPIAACARYMSSDPQARAGPVMASNATKGRAAKAILLAHFAAHPKPQTVSMSWRSVTGLNVGTLFIASWQLAVVFEREPGVDPRRLDCLKPHFPSKEVPHAGA